jgi:hypothetical protein
VRGSAELSNRWLRAVASALPGLADVGYCNANLWLLTFCLRGQGFDREQLICHAAASELVMTTE